MLGKYLAKPCNPWGFCSAMVRRAVGGASPSARPAAFLCPTLSENKPSYHHALCVMINCYRNFAILPFALYKFHCCYTMRRGFNSSKYYYRYTYIRSIYLNIGRFVPTRYPITRLACSLVHRARRLDLKVTDRLDAKITRGFFLNRGILT